MKPESIKSELITVVSVFFNRERSVGISVDSLLRSDTEGIEFLLVDDASSDRTHQELSKFSHIPNVRIVRNRTNIGFTRTIKHAIEEEARGSLIAIHGSGDISHRSRFEKQRSYLMNNPEFVAVGCHVATERSDGTYYCRKPSPKFKYWNGRSVPGVSPYSHGEVMFSKSAYLKVGGYRVAFKYAQDYDLWLRLGRVGKLGCLEEVLYERPHSSFTLRASLSKQISQQRYMSLARWSARLRDRGRQDIVDIEGEDSVLFSRYDLKSLVFLFRLLWKSRFKSNNIKASKFLITLVRSL